MSSRTTTVATVDPVEEGIECTPEGLVKGLAGCFGFLLSLIMCVALGITAGGIFWTAQSVERLTSNEHFINVRLCESPFNLSNGTCVAHT